MLFSTSSINLCPINFVEFGKINTITNNLEATLLFAKLKFHQINSKLQKLGRTWIARSREQIASWFGFGIKKTDNLLTFLEKLGLIKKKVGLWCGKRRLFITTTSDIHKVPVNLKLLNTLFETTGSIQAALLFAKIAYSFSQTKIYHQDIKWCCLKKQELADWAGLSIRTIDGLLDILIKKGLILKKKFVWKEKLQTHFHIPDFAIAVLKEQFDKQKERKNEQKQNPQNCRQQPAKMTVSIRIRTKEQKETNNITTKKTLSTTWTEENSDINFDRVGNKLTSRQLKYIHGALKNTIARNKIQISAPKELLEQLKFAVLHIQQHKKIQSFKHIVSRYMKILADGNWRTPKGFFNYSEIGRQLKMDKEKKLQAWTLQKEAEAKHARNFVERLKLKAFNPTLVFNKEELTQEAIQITKKIQHLSLGETTAFSLQQVKYLATKLEQLMNQGIDKVKFNLYLSKIIT